MSKYAGGTGRTPIVNNLKHYFSPSLPSNMPTRVEVAHPVLLETARIAMTQKTEGGNRVMTNNPEGGMVNPASYANPRVNRAD